MKRHRARHRECRRRDHGRLFAALQLAREREREECREKENHRRVERRRQMERQQHGHPVERVVRRGLHVRGEHLARIHRRIPQRPLMIRQRNTHFVLPRRELEELIDERPVVGVIESKVFRVIGKRRAHEEDVVSAVGATRHQRGPGEEKRQRHDHDRGDARERRDPPPPNQQRRRRHDQVKDQRHARGIVST